MRPDMEYDDEIGDDDESWDHSDFDDESAETRLERPPAVWPVFVAYAGAMGAIIGAQLVIAVGVIVWLMMNGGNFQEIDKDLRDVIAWPSALTAIASVTQLIVAAAGLVGAWCSGEGLGKALGFVKPRLPLYGWPLVILGAVPPALLGVALHLGLSELWPPDQTLEMTITRITWVSALPFILFISLTPGFIEEGFFRGYMQRRLLKRWSPFFAVFVSSALFALLHLDPHTIVFAFPFGIWLGVIAWRTGSIWPGVITHAVWNAGSVSWSIGENLLGFPEYPPLIPSIVVGIITLGCFLASIGVLARTTPPGPDDEVPEAALTLD